MLDFFYPCGITRFQQDLVFLLDTSSSMCCEDRINQLNLVMEEAVSFAEEQAVRCEIDLRMRVIEFNSCAKWIFGDAAHGVEHIDWVPLTAGGGTDTAAAIALAKNVMQREYLGERNLKPIVILITDGASLDPKATLAAIDALKFSLRYPYAPDRDKITRIAIGIGDSVDEAELTAFASVGKIVSKNDVQENVPFVFRVDDSRLLKKYLIHSVDMMLCKAESGNTIYLDDFELDDGCDWEE